MTGPPHILCITMDELRRDAISPYGCEAIETPNLARLAAEGVTFDAAYTASHLCLPSRCSMLTGRYPHRSGAYSNTRDCALNPGRACKNLSGDFWRKQRHHYYANIALIDDWIGAVLAAAEARFGKNLLILFTSDHGDMLGNHRLSGKNGCAYEDVLQVPLLARGADFAAGTRSNARVSLLDVLPTCLNAAGLDLPAGLDGRDLRRSLSDGGYEYIITEAEGFITIQDRRWKYLHAESLTGARTELYDLANDPREYANLAYDPAHAREIARLQGHLLQHFKATVLA